MRQLKTAQPGAADAPETLDGQTLAAFTGAVVIGGANFVAVSFSNRELPPLFGAALRFGLAAALFWMLAWWRGVRLPRTREAGGAALYGALGFGATYAGLYYALVGLSAGTVSVVMAAMPMFTLGLAVLLGQERLTARGLVGAALAIAGIAVLSAGSLGGDVHFAFLLAAVAGAVAGSASSVVARALREVHPLMMNAIGMSAGTVLLAAASLVLAEPWALPRQAATLAAVVWLVLLGSLGLFQLFLFVIRRWTASATVYAITAMPVVAVALGILLLGQPLTATVAAGGVLVMLAVYVGAIARPRQAAAGAARATAREPG